MQISAGVIGSPHLETEAARLVARIDYLLWQSLSHITPQEVKELQEKQARYLEIVRIKAPAPAS